MSVTNYEMIFNCGVISEILKRDPIYLMAVISHISNNFVVIDKFIGYIPFLLDQ